MVKYNKNEYEKLLYKAIRERKDFFTVTDFHKWLLENQYTTPSKGWLSKNMRKKIETCNAQILKKQVVRNGYNIAILPCLQQYKTISDYVKKYQQILNYIYKYDELILDAGNVSFEKYPQYRQYPIKKRRNDIINEMEKEGFYYGFVRKYIDEYFRENTNYIGEMIDEIIAKKIIPEIWLLRTENIKINDFVKYFNKKNRCYVLNSVSFEIEEEIDFKPFIKIVLLLFSDSSVKKVEDVYQECIKSYTKLCNIPLTQDGKVKGFDMKEFAGCFFDKYNSFINKTIEKRRESRIYVNKIEELKEYKKECEDRKIPPEIFFVQQQGFSKPNNDVKKRINSYFIEYNFSEQQLKWLYKVSEKWKNAYKTFTVHDFENIDRFKYVGREIEWYHNPNVPYINFVAYCLKIIKRYKENFSMLPKKDKTKELYDMTQLDWAVENLEFILDNQNLYPLHKKTIVYARNLLISFYASKGEKICIEYLVSKGYEIKTQVVFDDCFYKRKLRFDIRAEKKGKWFLVEFDGEQHYKYPNYFHKNINEFNEQKRRDEIKDKYCKEKGITLYRIRQDDLKNLQQVLAV